MDGYTALIIILINTHHEEVATVDGLPCRQLTVTLEDRSSTMQLQLDPIYKGDSLCDARDIAHFQDMPQIIVYNLETEFYVVRQHSRHR